MAYVKLDKEFAVAVKNTLTDINEEISLCCSSVSSSFNNNKVSLYNSNLTVYDEEGELIADYRGNARTFNTAAENGKNLAISVRDSVTAKVNKVITALDKVISLVDNFESQTGISLESEVGDLSSVFQFLSAYGDASSLSALRGDGYFGNSSLKGIYSFDSSLLEYEELGIWSSFGGFLEEQEGEGEIENSIREFFVGKLQGYMDEDGNIVIDGVELGSLNSLSMATLLQTDAGKAMKEEFENEYKDQISMLLFCGGTTEPGMVPFGSEDDNNAMLTASAASIALTTALSQLNKTDDPKAVVNGSTPVSTTKDEDDDKKKNENSTVVVQTVKQYIEAYGDMVEGEQFEALSAIIAESDGQLTDAQLAAAMEEAGIDVETISQEIEQATPPSEEQVTGEVDVDLDTNPDANITLQEETLDVSEGEAIEVMDENEVTGESEGETLDVLGDSSDISADDVSVVEDSSVGDDGSEVTLGEGKNGPKDDAQKLLDDIKTEIEQHEGNSDVGGNNGAPTEDEIAGIIDGIKGQESSDGVDGDTVETEETTDSDGTLETPGSQDDHGRGPGHKHGDRERPARDEHDDHREVFDDFLEGMRPNEDSSAQSDSQGETDSEHTWLDKIGEAAKDMNNTDSVTSVESAVAAGHAALGKVDSIVPGAITGEAGGLINNALEGFESAGGSMDAIEVEVGNTLDNAPAPAPETKPDPAPKVEEIKQPAPTPPVISNRPGANGGFVKPDVNLDKNGDGVPNLNIDTSNNNQEVPAPKNDGIKADVDKVPNKNFGKGDGPKPGIADILPDIPGVEDRVDELADQLAPSDDVADKKLGSSSVIAGAGAAAATTTVISGGNSPAPNIQVSSPLLSSGPAVPSIPDIAPSNMISPNQPISNMPAPSGSVSPSAPSSVPSSSVASPSGSVNNAPSVGSSHSSISSGSSVSGSHGSVGSSSSVGNTPSQSVDTPRGDTAGKGYSNMPNDATSGKSNGNTPSESKGSVSQPNEIEDFDRKMNIQGSEGVLGDSSYAELIVKNEKEVKVATGITVGSLAFALALKLTNVIGIVSFVLVLIAIILVYATFRVKKKKERKKIESILLIKKADKEDKKENIEDKESTETTDENVVYEEEVVYVDEDGNVIELPEGAEIVSEEIVVEEKDDDKSNEKKEFQSAEEVIYGELPKKKND